MTPKRSNLFALDANAFEAPKTKRLPYILKEFVWKELQAGRTEIFVEDTQAAFQATAQQVSKAVRRFNETGHELKWPGLHFSARVIGPFSIRIAATPTMI